MCLPHAARTARRVVDRLSRLRVEKSDHETNDGPWRVELAGVLLLHVGKLLDEVLVAVAHYVGGVVPVAEALLREVLNKVLETVVGKLALVCPTRVVEAAEQAAERVGVGPFDADHGVDDSLAHVGARTTHVPPVAAIRDDEAVVLRQRRVLGVSVRLR